VLLFARWVLVQEGEAFVETGEEGQDQGCSLSTLLDPAMRAAAGGAPQRRAGGIRVRAPLVSSAPLPPFLALSSTRAS